MMSNIPQPMLFSVQLWITPNTSLMSVVSVVILFSMIYWPVLKGLTGAILPLVSSQDLMSLALDLSDSFRFDSICFTLLLLELLDPSAGIGLSLLNDNC